MKKMMLSLMALAAVITVKGQEIVQTETSVDSTTIEQTTVNEQAETAPAAPVLRFGYISYEAVLTSMPEYEQMEKDMEQLRSQYEAEQKRVEDEFNNKYEDFLDGQANFPKTILQKRQSELQELLNRNIAFKKEGQELLAKAREDALAPLQAQVDKVLAELGVEQGYAFILNTDGNAAPWLNTTMGEDCTGVAIEKLKTIEEK